MTELLELFAAMRSDIDEVPFEHEHLWESVAAVAERMKETQP